MPDTARLTAPVGVCLSSGDNSDVFTPHLAMRIDAAEIAGTRVSPYKAARTAVLLRRRCPSGFRRRVEQLAAAVECPLIVWCGRIVVDRRARNVVNASTGDRMNRLTFDTCV